MQAIMEKELRVLSSMCDNTGRIGIPHIFSLFMDLASEHAPMIGLGHLDLGKEHLFWLTVKTRIRIFSRPALLEPFTARTWPEAPGRIACNRYYTAKAGEKLLFAGKTEWAILDETTGRLKRIAEVYPDTIEHCPDTVLDEPFARLSRDFSSCPAFASYTVRATDIDLGQHMNNAAYIRMLFGAFSTKQIAEKNIEEVEIAFISPCFEGEALTLHLREAADGTEEIGILHEDGKIAASVRILKA